MKPPINPWGNPKPTALQIATMTVFVVLALVALFADYLPTLVEWLAVR